jgi:cytochrome b6-f complex iron-sulfur subunit
MDQSAMFNEADIPLPEEREASEGAGLLSRRSLLKMGAGTLAALALAEMGGAGLLFLRSRGMAGEYGGVVKVGRVDDFPASSVTEFPDSHFYLIRNVDGGFLAVHNRCTHLGCTVNWQPAEGRFICPCHAATFDFFGNHQNPPVPRPLDTFDVQIQDAVVLIDTSQARQREWFAPEQMTYAPAGELSGGESGSPEG